MALPCKCETPVIKHPDGDFPICETCNRVVCNITKQMKLTEQCKEDFKKWLNFNEYNNIKDRFDHWLGWDRLTDSMKFGVLTEFFETKGIYINISNNFYSNGVNYLWQVYVYEPKSIDFLSDESTGGYGDNGEYTLSSSRVTAVERANEIYNKLIK